MTPDPNPILGPAVKLALVLATLGVLWGLAHVGAFLWLLVGGI